MPPLKKKIKYRIFMPTLLNVNGPTHIPNFLRGILTTLNKFLIDDLQNIVYLACQYKRTYTQLYIYIMCVMHLFLQVKKEIITSYLLRDKLNDTMTDSNTSCLAYFIRNGWVEKLLSVSSIIQTPNTSSEPMSGAVIKLKLN